MNQVGKNTESDRKIKNVTYLGLVINILLSALKVIFGILGNSMSLIADGLHSISDMATDLVVLIGVRFSSKEADEKHPYGHGRIETFSAVVISLVLVFLGFAMIYRAGAGITHAECVKPVTSVMLIAILSIVSKEYLYRTTRNIAVATGSTSLYANAWHHRSDAFSSVAVLAGMISMIFGFKYGDRIAAIAVGLMIVLAGCKILIDCMEELSEASVDKATVSQIRSIIGSDTAISSWHNLRTRMVGREIFIDAHILVKPELTISSAHVISENLENAIHQQVKRPVNITIHIEPDLPEFRK